MTNAYCDFLAQSLLDHFLKVTSYTQPTHVVVALSTADPTVNGSGLAEPSGNGYARVNCDGWTRTGRTASNTAAIDFGAASGGNWGTISHFALMDQSGNFLAFGPLTTPRSVTDGDPVEFPIGALEVSL